MGRRWFPVIWDLLKRSRSSRIATDISTRMGSWCFWNLLPASRLTRWPTPRHGSDTTLTSILNFEKQYANGLEPYPELDFVRSLQRYTTFIMKWVMINAMPSLESLTPNKFLFTYDDGLNPEAWNLHTSPAKNAAIFGYIGVLYRCVERDRFSMDTNFSTITD